MPWGYAAAAVGGALVSGVASNKAAKTQAQAADKASEVQQNIYNQTRQDLMPWQQAGTMALGDLQTRMGLGQNTGNPNFGQLTHQFNLQDFQESPAYQFNLQQGKMALDKASAARGKFYAPSTLQDIAKFSQGMASNEYQNAFSNYQTNMGNIWNRLNSLSSGGQNAAAQLGGFGTTVGSQIGQNITGAGNAQAAGQVGIGNALVGGANNFMNSQMWQQIMQNQQRGSTDTNYIEQG